jgi:hypothetical protein
VIDLDASSAISDVARSDNAQKHHRRRLRKRREMFVIGEATSISAVRWAEKYRLATCGWPPG